VALERSSVQRVLQEHSATLRTLQLAGSRRGKTAFVSLVAEAATRSREFATLQSLGLASTATSDADLAVLGSQPSCWSELRELDISNNLSITHLGLDALLLGRASAGVTGDEKDSRIAGTTTTTTTSQGTRWRRLACLCMSSLGKVRSVASIAEALPNLTSLNLSHCPNISAASVNLVRAARTEHGRWH